MDSVSVFVGSPLPFVCVIMHVETIKDAAIYFSSLMCACVFGVCHLVLCCSVRGAERGKKKKCSVRG